MKKMIKVLPILICALLIFSYSALADGEIGWKADFTKMDKILGETVDGADGTFITMDAPQDRRVTLLTPMNNEFGGFKAKFTAFNDVPWKAVAFPVTINVDKYPYFHFKSSASTVTHAVKVTEEQNPGDGNDLLLVPENSNSASEMVLDLKTTTGWSGTKTFWVKYFMIDSEKTGAENVLDVFCFTDSMKLVDAPATTTTTTTTTKEEEGATTTTTKAGGVTTTTKAGTTTKAAADNGGGVNPGVIIGIIAAVLVIAGVVTFIVIKKKKDGNISNE